jgi:hypothetical protein
MGTPVCIQVGITKKFGYGDPCMHNEIVHIWGVTCSCTTYGGNRVCRMGSALFFLPLITCEVARVQGYLHTSKGSLPVKSNYGMFEPQFTYPKLGINLPRPLVHKPTNFMVTLTSLMSELVIASIKFGMALLEVGPEFASNF